MSLRYVSIRLITFVVSQSASQALGALFSSAHLCSSGLRTVALSETPYAHPRNYLYNRYSNLDSDYRLLYWTQTLPFPPRRIPPLSISPITRIPQSLITEVSIASFAARASIIYDPKENSRHWPKCAETSYGETSLGCGIDYERVRVPPVGLGGDERVNFGGTNLNASRGRGERLSSETAAWR